MKTRLDPFPTFLRERFLPCVFIQISDGVLKQFPNFEQTFQTEWAAAAEGSPLKFRLVCPDRLPSPEAFTELTTNPRFIYPQSEPYDFFLRPPPPYTCEEMRTLSFLRQRLFEYNILPPYLYLDIPIAFLSVALQGEPTTIPLKTIGKWAKQIASKSKGFTIRIPNPDLPSVLKRFFEGALPERFKIVSQEIEEQHRLQWGNWRQSFADIFVSSVEPSPTQIALKRFADLRVSQGRFPEAGRLYYQLVETTPMTCVTFLAQVYMMISVCDIVKSTFSQDTITNLEKSRDIWRQQLHFLCVSFALFYVKLRLRERGNIILREITQIESRSAIVQLCKAFSYEQQAVLTKPHRAALLLHIAAEQYQQIEGRELQMKCLWMCLGIVSREGWELLHQQLICQIGQSNLRMIKQLSYYLCDSLRGRFIYFPEVLKQLVAASEPSKHYLAGFVKCRCTRIVSNPFMFSPPPYIPIWFPVAERLFGSYFRGQFFAPTLLDKYQSAVNGRIEISVRICSSEPLSHVKLIFDGTATAESTVQNGNGVLDFVVTPLQAGTLKITGVSFIWGAVTLQRFFTDNTIVFEIVDQIPELKIEPEIPSTSVYLGESFLVKFKITNGPEQLRRLAVVTDSDLEIQLIDPNLEDIVGTILLDPLGPNGSTNLTYAVFANSLGKKHLTFMFPFWTENSPPLYKYISVEFDVQAVIGLAVLCDITMIECSIPKSLNAIGFSVGDHKTSQSSHVVEKKAFLKRIGLGYQSFDIPIWAKTQPGLVLWLSDGFGFISAPIRHQLVGASFRFQQIEDETYEAIIVAERDLDDFRAAILDGNEGVSFLLTGKHLFAQKKIIKGEQTSWRVKIRKFSDAPVEVKAVVTCDQFNIMDSFVV